MAAIECGRGHLYDPEIYSACPYCNSVNQAVQFAGTPVGQGGKTMPIGGVADPGAPMPVGGVGANQFPGQSVLSEGKTLPPRGFEQKKEKSVVEDNKTIGVMKEKLGIDPVVGWLVCVSGKQKGQDYRLKGRINTIGRSEKMDISIKGDNTISNENHARLSYSEKNNRFNLIPAESTNIIYLNGEEVFVPALLSAYDVIDFGETKLVFVPLCCDQFDWNSQQAGGGDSGTV